MKSALRTDIGKVRASNEDASLILGGPYPLYAVADGMGGQRGGEVASALAVEGVAEALGGLRPSEDALRRCVSAVNRRIFDQQRREEALRGMGTTLTILWEGEEQVLLAHVGDSRAYLLRDGALEQVSRDHSLVAELLQSGALTPEEAAEHPYRHVITRAVGTERRVLCDISVLKRRPKDRWLLCSDGLSEHLGHAEILELLGEADLEQAAQGLVDRALAAGGRDNVTVIVLEVEG